MCSEHYLPFIRDVTREKKKPEISWLKTNCTIDTTQKLVLNWDKSQLVMRKENNIEGEAEKEEQGEKENLKSGSRRKDLNSG